MRKTIRWLTRSLLGLVVILVLFSAWVGYRIIRIQQLQPTPEAIIAKANTWPNDPREIRQRLETAPEKIISLIHSDRPEVRTAVASILHRLNLHSAPDSILDDFTALIAKNEGPINPLVSLLGSSGERGCDRLVSLFEKPEPLSKQLCHALHAAFTRPEAAAARRRLVAIIRSDSGCQENRTAAIEVLGATRIGALDIVSELEKFATEYPMAFAQPLRVAISRIRNTADIERITHDLDWCRLNAPQMLETVLEEIGQHGAALHAIGPEVIKELHPLGHDTGDMAALTLALINYREAIPVLMTALRDKDDWRLVAGAAEALGRLQAFEAEPELQKIAATHWHDDVRSVAKNAVAALHGKHVYKAPISGTRCLAIDHICTERMYASAPQHPRPSPWEIRKQVIREHYDTLGVRWVKLTAPIVHTVKIESPDGLLRSELWTMRPCQQMNWSHGTLLGYDDGEFGAGLIYLTATGDARYYAIPNVVALTRWKEGVLVTTQAAMSAECMLYYVQQTTNGIPSVNAFKRLPDHHVKNRIGTHGDILIEDRLRLTTEGELERIAPDH